MQKNCLGYPVDFIRDAFGESPALAERLRAVAGSDEPGVLIVADMNVVQRTVGLGTRIGAYVQAHGIRLIGAPVVIGGGEKIKADDFQSAWRVMSALLEAKLSARDIVLAIGGGTILDIAGYAAAQVRGGVRLVRMPTTPAAMMDAAFATYAAIDSATVKDALRVPSVPAAVVIDVSFAATVLDGVWRGGIGEAVRLAAVSDLSLVKRLEGLAEGYAKRDLESLTEVVTAVHAVRAKKGGTPFALWMAERLEAMSGYKLPHGYAVSIGIGVELGYAVERGLLKPADGERLMRLLRQSGALDGLAHSYHLLGQTERLLGGLEVWRLAQEDGAVVLPAGLGKATREAQPDVAIYGKVLANVISSAASV